MSKLTENTNRIQGLIAEIEELPKQENRLNSFFNKTITEITEADLEGATMIEQYAFQNCKVLKHVSIPNSVTSIGRYAFSQCKKLESINIPVGVTKIESYTFYYCESLTRIEIPVGVTEIGGSAFQGCYKMEHIEFPVGLKTVGGYAFYNCDQMTSFVFKEGLEEITSNYCIMGCDRLEVVDFPSTIIKIPLYTVRECSKLKKIIVRAKTPPTNFSKDSFSNNNSSFIIQVPAESLELYKSATNWSAYADRIFAIEE